MENIGKLNQMSSMFIRKRKHNDLKVDMTSPGSKNKLNTSWSTGIKGAPWELTLHKPKS